MKMPYMVIAVALVLLALVIARFKLPHIPEAEGGHAVVKDDSIWKHPNLVMGAIGIFTYVGAEVAIGSFLVNYLHEPNIGNLDWKRQPVSFVLLGRRHGRPLYRIGRTAEDSDAHRSGVQRIYRAPWSASRWLPPAISRW